MSRQGITYEDVATAAQQLKGQGKSITIEHIRAILGTGSLGTINNHLKKWKAAELSTQKLASKENLPEELIALLKGLWHQVIYEADKRIAQISTKHEDEMNTLETELEKFKNNNQRWQTLYNKWLSEKSTSDQQLLETSQALQFTQKENSNLLAKQDSLNFQLKEKQERIEELYRFHQQAQNNLEHYREASREQRLADQQQFEMQKQQLQSEIKQLTTQNNIQREKFSSLQQQFDILQTTQHSLETTLSIHFKKIDELTVKLNANDKVIQDGQQRYAELQTQYHGLQTTFTETTKKLAEAETRNQFLSNEIEQFRSELKMAKDLTQLLTHEKWILNGEKAQLEGQIKQMQTMITAKA